MSQSNRHKLASLYLVLQSGGAACWWVLLAVWPPSRRYFHVQEASELSLWAFLLPDAVLFIGLGFLAAWGLAYRRWWAWLVLIAHAGAAAYAALYCWSLTLVSGGQAWAAAILMTPALVFPGVLVWACRPLEKA